MNKIILFLLIGLPLLSCHKDDEDVVPGQLLLRIKNATIYKFDELYVNTSKGENMYGALQAGLTSPYKEFDAAYAYVQLKIQGDTFEIRPFDYDGEPPFTEGKYTFLLSMYDYEKKILQLEFKKE